MVRIFLYSNHVSGLFEDDLGHDQLEEKVILEIVFMNISLMQMKLIYKLIEITQNVQNIRIRVFKEG